MSDDLAPDVSIVIVNYNTRQLLADCLESIAEKTKGASYEVIVVDNDSADGSVEMLAERFPEVRAIRSGGNIGFGRANNLGAAAARGRYLFFLNSDTILLNDAVGGFLAFAESRPEGLGVIGCMLLNAERRHTNSFWFFPNYRRLLASRLTKLFFLKDRDRPEDIGATFEVDFITGADMFVSRAAFEEVGGFDPRFFMYYEETDLQLRLVQRGRHNYIVDGPAIVHLEGGSGKAKIGSRLRFERSMYLYFAKHGKSRAALFAFYATYSFLGIFSAPKYTRQENATYFAGVLGEMPRLIFGARMGKRAAPRPGR